jgi:ABC-type branched-subunit amino acid transport system substrate-binding protein
MGLRGSFFVVATAVACCAAVIAGCGGTSANGGSATGGGSGTSAGTSGQIDASACPPGATEALAAGAPIKIGMTIAQSGPLADLDQFVVGAEAYVDHIDATGGVEGHELEIVAKDDQFDPTKAVTNFRELAQQEEVMTVFSQIGSTNVAATAPLAEQFCTPQLWTTTGSVEEAANPAEHPWTTTEEMVAPVEAGFWAQAIKEADPNGAKVAMLVVNNDQGTALKEAFGEATKGSNISVSTVQEYETTAPTFSSQITAMLATKPDVVIGVPNNQDCPKLMTGLSDSGFSGQTILTWTCNSVLQHYAPAGAAANGAEVMAPWLDPGNPAAKGEPGVKEYLADMQKYASGTNPGLGYVGLGYNLAALLVSNLEAAAKSEAGLSRVTLMEAAWHTDATLPLGLPGTPVKLDWSSDPLLVKTAQLMRYDATKRALIPVGSPMTTEFNAP